MTIEEDKAASLARILFEVADGINPDAAYPVGATFDTIPEGDKHYWLAFAEQLFNKLPGLHAISKPKPASEGEWWSESPEGYEILRGFSSEDASIYASHTPRDGIRIEIVNNDLGPDPASFDLEPDAADAIGAALLRWAYATRLNTQDKR